MKKDCLMRQSFLFENGEDDDLKGEESAQKKVWSEPKSKKSAH